MKVTKEHVIAILLACALASVLALLAVLENKNIKKLREKDYAIVNIKSAINEPMVNSKYDFIDTMIAVYIEQLSIGSEVDPDLAFAILMVENPQFDIYAMNRNDNGTIDEGLYQLNDRYFWTTFRNNYWKFEEIEPDPFNWKHNAFIAINHIAYLQNTLKVQEDVIMAYNCGIGAVLNNNIPPASKVYLAKVNNNLKLLKSIGEN